MKRINMYTAFIFGAQLSTACLFSMLGTKWLESNATANYLSIDQDAPDFGLIFQSVDTWVLLFANFIPISLIVSLELVKFFQAYFIHWDILMLNEKTN